MEEVELRIKQASRALQQLRLALGLKSALYRNLIRGANTQYKKTRAWRSLKPVEGAVKRHTQEYRMARQALVQLGASPPILARFPVLKKEDCKMSGDIVEENRVGQRSEHLSWVWRVDCGATSDKKGWEEESKFIDSYMHHSADLATTKLNVSIGCVPKQDISAGKRKLSFLKMKWSGPSCGLNTKCGSGKTEKRWP
jgi:hypothetical protein